MKRIAYITLATIIFSSCVTQKKYDALNSRKNSLETENAECQEKLTATSEELEELKVAMSDFEKKYFTKFLI